MDSIESKLLILNPRDNVAISLSNQEIKGNVIPFGHKIALKNINPGESIIKYGNIIGVASKTIYKNEQVHTANTEMANGTIYDNFVSMTDSTIENFQLPQVFQGFLRNDGRVGIRNYLAVLSTVNCSATVTKKVCRHFINKNLPKGIDGVIPIVHTQGCAQVIEGSGYNLLNSTLYGWLFHPNIVGAIIIQLGCEQTTFDSVLQTSVHKQSYKIPIEIVTIQSSGGALEAINAAIMKIEKMIKDLPHFERQEQPLSKLIIGLNCGGSDAFSGITANPCLGRVTDCLVSEGGTVIFGEIPECHGTEELLLSRCKSQESKNKLIRIFDWWKKYIKNNDASFNNNLALGNIEGGLTTIIEKSLGAISKAGHLGIKEVLAYAEKPGSSGLHIMNTPGYDPVSVTGLVAAGCNLVLFTTGRGSTYGCAISPTIKISSNSTVFNKMKGDIDLDAGKILDGISIDNMAKEIMKEGILVASGKKTSSEQLDLGWEEFVPWNLGVTL